MANYFYWREDILFLQVYLQPRASHNKIIGPHNGCLKIKLTSPPLDGKANKELISLLSKEFKTPQQNIVIISGQSSRQKWLRIEQPRRLDLLKYEVTG